LKPGEKRETDILQRNHIFPLIHILLITAEYLQIKAGETISIIAENKSTLRFKTDLITGKSDYSFSLGATWRVQIS
jgi:hypothetical protein